MHTTGSLLAGSRNSWENGTMTILEEPRQTANVVVISAELAIPADELSFRFSHSGGPGGQHVNKTETRVDLLFDVKSSPSLTEEQRHRLLVRLSGRIDSRGILHVTASDRRSQLANRDLAVARFQALLSAALRRRKHRVPTKPSAAAEARRMAAKRARSQIKNLRRQAPDSDG